VSRLARVSRGTSTERAGADVYGHLALRRGVQPRWDAAPRPRQVADSPRGLEAEARRTDSRAEPGTRNPAARDRVSPPDTVADRAAVGQRSRPARRSSGRHVQARRVADTAGSLPGPGTQHRAGRAVDTDSLAGAWRQAPAGGGACGGACANPWCGDACACGARLGSVARKDAPNRRRLCQSWSCRSPSRCHRRRLRSRRGWRGSSLRWPAPGCRQRTGQPPGPPGTRVASSLQASAGLRRCEMRSPHPIAIRATASYRAPAGARRERNSVTCSAMNSRLGGAGSSLGRRRARRVTRASVTWGR
jgi:hypothetical protein